MNLITITYDFYLISLLYLTILIDISDLLYHITLFKLLLFYSLLRNNKVSIKQETKV